MSGGESAQRMARTLAAEARVARQRAAELDQEAAWWAQGADGERRVAELLDALAPDVVALHDRLIAPGRSAVNLDHVVVTHSGIFVLDTKNWQADLTVHHDMLWRHVGPPHSRSHAPQDRALAAVGRYADTLATELGVPVHPVLVLAADRHARLEPRRVAGVHVLPMGCLRGWLMRWPVVLADDQRDSLVLACSQRYPEGSTQVAAPSPPPTGFRPSATESIAPGPGLPRSALGTARRTAPRTEPSAAPAAPPARRTRRAQRRPRRSRPTGRRPRALVGLLGLLATAALAPTAGHWVASLLLAVASGAAHR